jgi:fumarate reductase flavoprotein subunit
MQQIDPRAERATRDIVSRGIYAEMRAGRTTPAGGVWISMSHLGPDNVRRQFKGMVERCGDCGFDLAAGRVEVVPTAHYMMGGVVFAPDCSTPLPGLFAAGEDTGGVHGANRLGGNGVANSTVFGGIAGDRMAAWVRSEGTWQAADEAAILRSIAAHTAPFGRAAEPGAIEAVRDAISNTMWDEVGILRDADGLRRAIARLDTLEAELQACGVDGRDRAFHPGWHDWMNLRNLLQVSRTIAVSALAREDSRGAHYREDFPEPGAMEDSSFIVVRQGDDGQLALQRQAVRFSRVRPGQSLVAA